MNLGLGFTFSGMADGLVDAAKSVKSGVGGVVSAVGGMADAVTDKIGNMSQVLQMSALNDIKGSISSFTGMDTDVARLTSTFESMRVESDAALSRIGAGLDMSGRELNRWKGRVTSAAIATNVGIGDAAQAFEALARNQIELADHGIPSFEDFIRIMQVTGMDASKFAESSAMLTKQLGLTGDQAASLYDDFALIAKQTGLGTESLNGMGDQLDALRPLLVGTLQRRGPEAVMTMLRSTQMLSGVMQEAFGGDPQQNMAAALALTQKLAESQDELNGVFVGMGDIPEFQTQVATNFGSMAEAQELMSTDAVTFISRLRDMKAGLEAKSPLVAATFMERMSRQLREIDPNLAALFTGAENVNEAFAEMGDPSGPLKGAEGALVGMGKAGHKTARTLSENLQLAMDGFDQKLRDIKGAEIDRLFYDEVIPAIGDFGNELKTISEEGGILGQLIDRMSMFEKVGAGAFLPLDTEWGKKVFVLTQVMAPFVDKILLFVVAAGAAAAGIASMVTAGVALAPVIGSILGAVGTAIGSVASFFGFLAGWPAIIIAVIAGVALLGAAIVGLGTETGEKVFDFLDGILDKTIAWASNMVPQLIEVIDGWVQELLSIDTEEAAQAFSDWLNGSATEGVSRAGTLLTKSGQLAALAGQLAMALIELSAIAIGVAGEIAAEYFMDEWITPMGYLLEQELVKPLTSAWDAFMGAIAGAAKYYFGFVKNNWITMFKFMVSPVDGMIDAVGRLYAFVGKLFGNSVHDIIAADFAQARDLVLPILDAIGGGLQGMFDGAISLAGSFLNVWTSVFDGVRDAATTVFETIGRAIARALEKIGLPVEYLKRLGDSIGVDFSGATISSDADNTIARSEGKRAMQAAGDSESQMLILIGEVRLMRNQLHKDLVQIAGKVSSTRTGRVGIGIDGSQLVTSGTGGS